MSLRRCRCGEISSNKNSHITNATQQLVAKELGHRLLSISPSTSNHPTMKQRITSLDLRIITCELQENITNYRLQNIYNVIGSSRQYVLKFSVPDSKKSVVIDCGNKLHLSDFERPTAPAPSKFVTKLRKHLKARRLSLLKQVGNDRVLAFQFSDGLFYLVLEFFSAGNILLLDHDMKILALHRLVNDLGPENDKYAVNEVYKMFDLSLFTEDEPLVCQPMSVQNINEWITNHKSKLSEASSDKKKKVFSIHKLLFVNASYLSSDLILKALIGGGIDASQSCLGLESDQELLFQTVKALEMAQTQYDELIDNAKNGLSQGTIVEKKNPLYNPEDLDSLEYTFDEFHPFPPHKIKSDLRFQAVKGYNQTLDNFFSTIESTKYALRIQSQKQHAEKRLNNARSERDKQIQLLLTQQEINEKRGNTIIHHAQLVEECKGYLQAMLNKQMDWTDIENIIKFDAAKRKGEAKYFRFPLSLLQNKIKLALPDPEAAPESLEIVGSDLEDSSSDSDVSSSESDSDPDSSDAESETDSDAESVESFELQKAKKKQSTRNKEPSIPTITVDIDLTLSSFANARLYYDSKKVAVNKQTKVEKSSGMALKNAEKKIQRDLAKNLKGENDALRSIRPKYWFEKYYWFVTSDNYLCLAGRDDSQIDMIYYRHFSDSGYFVSSDMENSLNVFILNPFQGEDVSPTALFQAGIFAMLASHAWNSKVSASAWWLKGSEVTKKEFDNSLLGPGRLNFKGKKNFMPPAQLVMGFGLYWLGDEETATAYTKARTDRQTEHGLKIEITNKKRDLENITITSKESIEPELSTKQGVDQEEAVGEVTEAPAFPTETPHTISKSTVGSTKTVRGKKGKMKKINEKYAHQDEEERKLRMEALGTLKQVQDLEKQKLEEAKHQAELERKKYAAAKKGAQREQRAEERELQKYLQGDDEDDSVSYLELLDSLIAKPGKMDTIATAVPVFAPWSALSKFKYKTKIQPGMAKKGKSVTESLNYFTGRKTDALKEDPDIDWPEEHEIIKSLKSNDLIGVVSVNKLKLVLPGGNASDNKSKKGAKKGRK
ncbi:hypothetical protein METBIDRAFT_61911 [Metschnikowia bicuspidata var. bicuspidata NRRL YB-4993]|uniref:Ribosome quality control complex subunit 2 n=1 Tax=Metschnikowia bicuspidata var. bicuspidata NRRL YB-4993 TaxID=869754 RepID=A0A1A0GZ26_9ASCO|nr:hypothetical protein METBIDRAFT_61911 [Metschnikowia bicuspidata var. bicuspidata NRRL YB-4993]OBA17006.1 hypothetical protein METBIDRAFT_61911 [Metschnikowia bicuspidata var. bicuspidata NRRL YB-4993]